MATILSLPTELHLLIFGHVLSDFFGEADVGHPPQLLKLALTSRSFTNPALSILYDKLYLDSDKIKKFIRRSRTCRYPTSELTLDVYGDRTEELVVLFRLLQHHHLKRLAVWGSEPPEKRVKIFGTGNIIPALLPASIFSLASLQGLESLTLSSHVQLSGDLSGQPSRVNLRRLRLEYTDCLFYTPDSARSFEACLQPSLNNLVQKFEELDIVRMTIQNDLTLIHSALPSLGPLFPLASTIALPISSNDPLPPLSPLLTLSSSLLHLRLHIFPLLHNSSPFNSFYFRTILHSVPTALQSFTLEMGGIEGAFDLVMDVILECLDLPVLASIDEFILATGSATTLPELQCQGQGLVEICDKLEERKPPVKILVKRSC